MNYFINYSINTGLSINTYRDPNASFGDITDLVKAVAAGDESVSCALDDGEHASAKAALEDGSLWQASEQDAIERIHALICEFEAEHLVSIDGNS